MTTLKVFFQVEDAYLEGLLDRLQKAVIETPTCDTLTQEQWDEQQAIASGITTFIDRSCSRYDSRN